MTYRKDDNYTDDLNKLIDKYNERLQLYEDEKDKKSSPIVLQTNLSLVLIATLGIQNEANKPENSSFINSNRDAFNGKIEDFILDYNDRIAPAAPSDKLKDKLSELVDLPLLREEPDPAPDVEPLREIDAHADAPQGTKSKILRGVSYGLFGLSAVSGVGGTVKVIEGTGKVVFKEGVKAFSVEGAKKIATHEATVQGGKLLLGSAASYGVASVSVNLNRN